MNNSHESFPEHALEGPSNRSFGYTVGGILLAFVFVKWAITGVFTFISVALAVAGLVLVVLALVHPGWLSVPNRLWMGLGMVMFKVVNPVLMLLIYSVAFVPLGVFLKWRGYNPLAGALDRSAVSYWTARAPHEPDPATMRNQF
ncbi:hypothetical protein GOC91_22455 [Sinorhizobium medicae]|uniref:Transmembrane protein n=2 Tax=Sinorhizobium medicae TaxID=110321 RepID=A0A6G1WP05_9HYPH|nr:hypothetical protein [Sinorhizobium medicae]ABR60812.1 conserved hypothetical protein [Sinorhizobium medicae WSM419]MBO1943869.1 hypothetical protein [Sinorhizobium medicae]MBO1964947.1 hypothetical protein [Sinorhizobium medicae]MDX0406970.1 hypothetical protein [Sinorhizobium medicae]MDX0412603.1 hypothetical protein [Sinorhizobium medicae]